MDDARFDAIVKAMFAQITVRRAVMRGVVAGAIGSAAGAVGLGDGGAKRKKKKKCKGGKKRCGKKCVDLKNDRNNCGGCGNRCHPGRPDCIAGECSVAVCPDDALFCTPGGSGCAPNCGCASDVDGKRFCALNVTCAAVDCATNADCVARGFGANSACIIATGEFCDCAKGCAVPCAA